MPSSKYQDSGVLVQLPGYRDPLALSARDLHAVVAEESVVTVWEVPYELRGVGCFGGGADLLEGHTVDIPKAHVVADRVVEYHALLCDVPDTCSQPVLVDVAVRDASNRNHARGRTEYPSEKGGERRLPGSLTRRQTPPCVSGGMTRLTPSRTGGEPSYPNDTLSSRMGRSKSGAKDSGSKTPRSLDNSTSKLSNNLTLPEKSRNRWYDQAGYSVRKSVPAQDDQHEHHLHEGCAHDLDVVQQQRRDKQHGQQVYAVPHHRLQTSLIVEQAPLLTDGGRYSFPYSSCGSGRLEVLEAVESLDQVGLEEGVIFGVQN